MLRRKRSHWRLFFAVCVLVSSALFIFQIGFMKGQECGRKGLLPCQESGERNHLVKTAKKQTGVKNFESERSALKKTRQDVHVRTEVVPSMDKDMRPLSLDKLMGIPSAKMHHHLYVQIRESDSPILGDFTCGGTVVPKCCAFYVETPSEGKKICDAFTDFCKGFVMTTLSTSVNRVQYMIYLKKSLKGMVGNYITDFYVKSVYVNEIKWNGPTADDTRSKEIDKTNADFPIKFQRNDIRR